MSEPTIRFLSGATYEQSMGGWSRCVGEPFLDWLAMPSGARWLDVGCGSGVLCELLVERCAPAEVHGIDPSEGQLAYARTRPAARLAQFRQGDAMELPYESASFDAAVMALVIAFVPEPAKAVAEMVRVVRLGGVVATYMWDLEARATPHAPVAVELKAMERPVPQAPNPRAGGIEAMRRLWADAGLETIVTRQITVERTFEDFDAYWSNIALIDSVAPILAAMPDAEIAEVRARVAARLPAEADGRITHTARANAIMGRRPA